MSSESSSILRHHFFLSFNVCCVFFTLCPTSDTNLVKSLMNLMDCMMDEFHNKILIKYVNTQVAAAS